MKKLILMMITLIMTSSFVIVNAQMFYSTGGKKDKKFLHSRKEIKKAFKQGTLSLFGYEYMNDFYNVLETESDEKKFIGEFEEMQSCMLQEKKFVPELERILIDSSLFVEKRLFFSTVKKATRLGVIRQWEARDIKSFYIKNYYDYEAMKFFIKRYNKIEKEIYNEEKYRAYKKRVHDLEEEYKNNPPRWDGTSF